MRHVVERSRKANGKPLSEPVFLILASLAEEPKHGYGLLHDIREISNERVVLSTGTLYGALRRLLEDGLIERFRHEDTSRDKQVYKLTGEGLRQLRLEVERMKHLARAASIRMRGSEA